MKFNRLSNYRMFNQFRIWKCIKTKEIINRIKFKVFTGIMLATIRNQICMIKIKFRFNTTCYMIFLLTIKKWTFYDSFLSKLNIPAVLMSYQLKYLTHSHKKNNSFHFHVSLNTFCWINKAALKDYFSNNIFLPDQRKADTADTANGSSIYKIDCLSFVRRKILDINSIEKKTFWSWKLSYRRKEEIFTAENLRIVLES